MFLLFVLVAIISPLLALLGAVFRGLILGLPVMWVPALDFWQSAGVIALLSLLIPTSSGSSSKD